MKDRCGCSRLGGSWLPIWPECQVPSEAWPTLAVHRGSREGKDHTGLGRDPRGPEKDPRGPEGDYRGPERDPTGPEGDHTVMDGRVSRDRKG
ncbi:unnamed protein product [Lota lota]